MACLHLDPAPIPPAKLDEWQRSGRTLNANLKGIHNELAVFVSPKPSSDPLKPQQTTGVYHAERAVFFCRWDTVAPHLVPFYSKAYTLFVSLQRFASETNAGQSPSSRQPNSNVPTPVEVNFYSRLAGLYVRAIREHFLIADPSDSELSSPEVENWSFIAQIVHLAQILYMPEDGRGEGPVAEELLDWVNRADVGPTTEEGEEILASRKPWEHEEFWTYLIRSLLRGFLVSASQLILTLSSHPSPILSKLAPRLASLVDAYPRSSSPTYATDRAFLNAHSAWRSQLATALRPLATPDWGSEGDWEVQEGEGAQLETDVQSLVEVLEGKEHRIVEESVDWKEALGAWGLWIRPSSTRDDIPETVARLLESLPVDVNLPEEQIEVALLQGNITRTITLCNSFSVWLVTHLTDLLDKLGLVEAPLPEHPRSLRTHFLIEYAEHLQTDPSLWMMVCEYLAGCGEEGKGRIAVLLSRIGLDAVEDASESDNAIDEAKVEEVFKYLAYFSLEEESRQLARVVAERYIRTNKFGLAVVYSVRAGDGRRLGVIADKVLDEYVRKGPAEFIDHVNSIPPSLFSPDSPHFIPGPPHLAHLGTGDVGESKILGRNITFPVLASRLSFLPTYRDFLEAYESGDRRKAADLLVRMLVNGLAPVGFWAVLLLDSIPLLEDSEILFPSQDAYELLRHVEEVVSASSHSPADYLSYLVRLQSARGSTARSKARTKANGLAANTGVESDQEREGYAAALKGLDVVRLALARYLAREVLG